MENRHNAIQQPTEVLIKELELEEAIRRQLEDARIYFDYSLIQNPEDAKNPLIKLDLITINPQHNQKFLFHSVRGHSKIDLLEQMIDYIKNYKKNLESYEIEWMDAQLPDKVQVSWFRGNDIFDVLNKFYYDKEKSRFRILKIKLMPEA
ncbi:hypothetical protein FHS56_000244 [Thermonema lapsum]|jgi:hypothetical protein|uniref:Uncharacterized protein n=1 Tax=Thermonema lapsum TaxID=28195 RepID=A0A846MMI6_9BACT|nr:hypothetical protein [Thermonema lapsum]NIK72758.1 hypothetical protein [Thermonema lapsum]